MKHYAVAAAIAVAVGLIVALLHVMFPTIPIILTARERAEKYCAPYRVLRRGSGVFVCEWEAAGIRMNPGLGRIGGDHDDLNH